MENSIHRTRIRRVDAKGRKNLGKYAKEGWNGDASASPSMRSRALPHLNKMAASNYLKRMVTEGYLDRIFFSKSGTGNKPNVYMKTGKKMASYDLISNEKAWTKHGRN